jgi:hypothetical protein
MKHKLWTISLLLVVFAILVASLVECDQARPPPASPSSAVVAPDEGGAAQPAPVTHHSGW